MACCWCLVNLVWASALAQRNVFLLLFLFWAFEGHRGVKWAIVKSDHQGSQVFVLGSIYQGCALVTYFDQQPGSMFAVWTCCTSPFSFRCLQKLCFCECEVVRKEHVWLTWVWGERRCRSGYAGCPAGYTFASKSLRMFGSEFGHGAAVQAILILRK